MILVDWQILDRISRGYIKIDPFDPALVQPNSLDIRLGNHFVWYEEGDEVIDPYNEGDNHDRYDRPDRRLGRSLSRPVHARRDD